jgi:23S rRNA (uridine2552-2'-O)-methyltransferase
MKKIQDHYFHKARREGFRARSVYKLQEADRKYGLLKKGCMVLDLGAAPGSWSKYAAGRVGPQGYVVAVDLKRIDNLGSNVRLVQRDISGLEPAELLAMITGDSFDVVLSDMAPRTTGNRGVDHLKSIGLAESALCFAESLITAGGAFYCKVFEGGDLHGFRQKCQAVFQTVKIFKPKSSRSESVEIFLLCRNRRKA